MRGALNLTMYVATSDDSETWSSWEGPYYANQSSGVSPDVSKSRHLKYRATLTTENASYSPVLEAVGVSFHIRPGPFVIENLGTLPANVTLYATDFFSTASNPSSSYFFKVSDYEPGSIGACSATSWTQMPNSSSPALAVCSLGTSPTANEARIDVKITVPDGEPQGAKNSQAVFSASQA